MSAARRDVASIQELFVAARRAVEAELDVELGHVELEILSLDQMSDLFLEEGLWTPQAEGYDASVAEDQRRIMAHATIGKYAWKRGAIVVASDANAVIAASHDVSVADIDGILSSLLLHELVHAADAAIYDAVARAASLQSNDEVRAFSAVLEGHAQFVSRRLARGLGIEREFELFTRILTESDGDAVQALGPSALARTTYLDGERFVARLHAAGGADAIRAVFSRPPRRLSDIDDPQGFLRGEEPADRLGWEEARAHARSLLATDAWIVDERSMSLQEFSATLRPLPGAEIARVAELRVQSHYFRAVNRAGPLSGELLLQLFEFESTAGAGAYLDAYGRVRKLRDEQLATGDVRLDQQVYRDVSSTDRSGLAFEKRAILGGEEVRIRGVCIARGRVIVELVLRNLDGWDEAAALHAAEEITSLLLGASDAARVSDER